MHIETALQDIDFGNAALVLINNSRCTGYHSLCIAYLYRPL